MPWRQPKRAWTGLVVGSVWSGATSAAWQKFWTSFRLMRRTDFCLIWGSLLPSWTRRNGDLAITGMRPWTCGWILGDLTAYDLVNTWPEKEIARILSQYGEERFARRIAGHIVERRKRTPIQTTRELADIIKEAIPAPARRRGPHPARRSFQAIRIAVNDELGALSSALDQAIKRLRSGGRICVISFHSLEDRICKRIFQAGERGCICPSDFPVCVCNQRPILRSVTKKPVLPSPREVEQNPRARSAKLRIAEKI